MACGKKPLVKTWDKPKVLQKINASKYEKNEASVKQHWKNVIRDLENSYKDDQFWETQSDLVHQLVGPTVFQRLTKIFNLPVEFKYEAQSSLSSITPSEEFYVTTAVPETYKEASSMSDMEMSEEEVEEILSDEASGWSTSTAIPDITTRSSRKSMDKSITSRVTNFSKSWAKMMSRQSRLASRKSVKTSHLFKSESSLDATATSQDDIEVLCPKSYFKKTTIRRTIKNPHFEMLHCNESETDMIKWKSKYKQKTFEVSASDEFSKKAEIMTKKIAKEFYDWWVDLGNGEFKSEIRRPEDIEDLFQVWFDEHASRGLKLDARIMPCVLKSIADYVGVPKMSCLEVLKRQIAYDIHAETSPAHTEAFNTCLPQKMKHIPPKNNTKEMWDCVVIPEDLKTMACVWEDIQHLTSTKEFHRWLEVHPHLAMPPVFQAKEHPDEKKQLFTIPSDYVVRDTTVPAPDHDELALPVSQYSMELKDVLDHLMNK